MSCIRDSASIDQAAEAFALKLYEVATPVALLVTAFDEDAAVQTADKVLRAAGFEPYGPGSVERCTDAGERP